MAWYVAQIEMLGGGFAVTYPDAPAIRVTAGTLEVAVERAGETLALQLESLSAKGVKAPRPTPLSAFDAPAGAHVPMYALVEIAVARQSVTPTRDGASYEAFNARRCPAAARATSP